MHLRIKDLCDNNHTSDSSLQTDSCGQFSCEGPVVFHSLARAAFMETHPQACGFLQPRFPFLQQVARTRRPPTPSPPQLLRTDELPEPPRHDFVNDQLHNIFSLEFIGIMEVT